MIIMKTDKLREECAVFGVSLVNSEEAAGIVFKALLALQRRGQESAGVAVSDGSHIVCRKGEGLVSEVFPEREFNALPNAGTAVGHALYSKAGANKKEKAGPFVTEYLTGRIATALNGSITNADELRADLSANGLYFETGGDGELVSSLIAYCVTKERNILSGAILAANLLAGAFSFVFIAGNMLIAIRDPSGLRPLCLGWNAAGYAVASESCALDSCGFDFIRDIRPGEAVVVENGVLVTQDVMLAGSDKTAVVVDHDGAAGTGVDGIAGTNNDVAADTYDIELKPVDGYDGRRDWDYAHWRNRDYANRRNEDGVYGWNDEFIRGRKTDGDKEQAEDDACTYEE